MLRLAPMFRHLFGVDEDELWDWETTKWVRYRGYALAWARSQGWEV